MTDAQAEVQMMTLKETLPGFLDAQGSNTRAVADSRNHQDAWIASFMEYADMILATHRVQADLVANFMILSTTTARSIQTTQIAEFRAPDETVRSVTSFMRKSTGDDDLLLSLRPVSLRQFQGVNIIPLAPYNTDEGVTNVLEEVHTFGMFHLLHLPNWAEEGGFEWWRTSATFTIPDFEKRNDRAFHIINPRVPTESTFRGTTVPTNGILSDANRVNPFVAFRKNMQEKLGPIDTYESSAIRFLFYTSLLRFLPYTNATFHYELHLNGQNFMNKLLSYYEQFYHMLDTWTLVRKREHDKYHVFTRITSHAEFRQRYGALLATLERSGLFDGTNQTASDTTNITAAGANSSRMRVLVAGLRAEHFFSMHNVADSLRNVDNIGSNDVQPDVAVLSLRAITMEAGQVGQPLKVRYDQEVGFVRAFPLLGLASGVNTCHQTGHNIMSEAIGCNLGSSHLANDYTMAISPMTDASAYQFLLDVLFLMDQKEHVPIFVPSVPVTVPIRFPYRTDSIVDIQTDIMHADTVGYDGAFDLVQHFIHLKQRTNGAVLVVPGGGGVAAALVQDFINGMQTRSPGSNVSTATPAPETILCNLPVRANYANILVVRPKVRLATESILYGIGGKVTGVTALGQERYEEQKRYTEQDEQFRVKMRMAVCLAHPEHIIRMESAKYRRYMDGATADVFTETDFGINASEQFSMPHRKRVPLHKSKDAILMALPAYSNSNTADMTNHTNNVAITGSDVPHYLTFRDINTSVIPGKHVGTPFIDELVSYEYDNYNTRAANGLRCNSYVLVGNGMILTGRGPCADAGQLTAFRNAARNSASNLNWTVKAAPDAKPAKTDVLCWESQTMKADITDTYRPTVSELTTPRIFNEAALQAALGNVDAGAAAVVRNRDIGPDNAALHRHIAEHVTRGPFRFLSPKTAVDVWNGRSMQSVV